MSRVLKPMERATRSTAVPPDDPVAFADALQADRAYEVVRTQLPFDTTSAGTLSGDIGSSEGNDTPRFTITLSRKAGK